MSWLSLFGWEELEDAEAPPLPLPATPAGAKPEGHAAAPRRAACRPNPGRADAAEPQACGRPLLRLLTPRLRRAVGATCTAAASAGRKELPSPGEHAGFRFTGSVSLV